MGFVLPTLYKYIEILIYVKIGLIMPKIRFKKRTKRKCYTLTRKVFSSLNMSLINLLLSFSILYCELVLFF